jgi:hypothetical protein
LPKNIKELVEKVWAQSNRSPFDTYNKKEHLEPPPKNWKRKLEDLINARVLSILAQMEKERDAQETQTAK